MHVYEICGECDPPQTSDPKLQQPARYTRYLLRPGATPATYPSLKNCLKLNPELRNQQKFKLSDLHTLVWCLLKLRNYKKPLNWRIKWLFEFIAVYLRLREF